MGGPLTAPGALDSWGAMARAPLLQLSGTSLTHGGDPVLDGVDLVVQAGDRVALVGRNGSGKSTLMKIMAGLVEADAGERVVPPGVTVGYMEQEPTFEGFETIGAFAASGLPEGEGYRVEVVAEGLKFDPETKVSAASGGWSTPRTSCSPAARAATAMASSASIRCGSVPTG